MTDVSSGHEADQSRSYQTSSGEIFSDVMAGSDDALLYPSPEAVAVIIVAA